MASKMYAKHFFKVIYSHSVHPPSAGWLSLLPNFEKRGPGRISIFGERLLEKGSDLFQQGGELAVFT